MSNHARRNGVHILGRPSGSGISEQQARQDATALLAAKHMEMVTGTNEFIVQVMDRLIEDPERIGSCTLSLLNLVVQFATRSGQHPLGLQELVDYLLKTLGLDDDTAFKEFGG